MTKLGIDSGRGRAFRAALIAACTAMLAVAACSDSGDEAGSDADGLSSGGTASTGSGSGSGGSNSGSGSGSGGTVNVSGGTNGQGGDDSMVGAGGFEACTGSANEQEEQPSPLDIYLIFDRTSSMGTLSQGQCQYVAGDAAPVNTQSCYAKYALADYLINVEPEADTRLGFQFLSLPGDSCDGTAYSMPLVDLTSLPLEEDDQLIQTLSAERFQGGYGTETEGALRGIATFTANNATPGREMIGVLMTDGDPNGCDGNIDNLTQIIADHLADTGIRTFIIGMDGANHENLEQLAAAGGAEPHDDYCGDVGAPCHFWNVGNGSGDALADALQSIVKQATPLPCEYPVDTLSVPDGETIDYKKVNVELTDPDGEVTTIGWVKDEDDCPADGNAWYYDDPTAKSPESILLCPSTCDLVAGAATGARVTVVVGCKDTVPSNVPK